MAGIRDTKIVTLGPKLGLGLLPGLLRQWSPWDINGILLDRFAYSIIDAIYFVYRGSRFMIRKQFLVQANILANIGKEGI
jgi:hypothetical protein